MPSIAIFGGNGFLGKKLCEVGVKLGWDVTAFSRSGVPSVASQWSTKVNWEAANIFEPDTYKNKLSQYDTVVHSIGILFENQSYKKRMNSNFNALNEFQSLMNSLKGSNPMEKNPLSTYEAIQRDSAVILADAFIESKKGADNSPSFVYISADKQIPTVPSRYLSTKREAEFELSCKKDLRTIIMRPGMMYDARPQNTTPRDVLANVLKFGYGAKSAIAGDSVPMLNSIVRPPVSTEMVAMKMYQKLGEKDFNGIVTLDEINAKSSPAHIYT